MKWIASLLACSFGLLACGESTSDPNGDQPAPGAPVYQSYRYVGSCTPSECGDAIPEIACADGETIPTCSANAGGSCNWTVDCSSDPDGTVSWSQCQPSQCGDTPGQPADGCAPGYQWGEPSCGSLNGGACQWAQGCYPKPSAEACAESECPTEIGLAARICDDGSTAQVACRRFPDRCDWQHECPEDFPAPGIDRSKLGQACDPNDQTTELCPEGEQCVSFEGLAGTYCAADPCAVISCDAPKQCAILESFPAQIRCQ